MIIDNSSKLRQPLIHIQDTKWETIYYLQESTQAIQRLEIGNRKIITDKTRHEFYVKCTGNKEPTPFVLGHLVSYSALTECTQFIRLRSMQYVVL